MHHADVIVIGGGAAGMMSAVSASEAGASTIVLEKNEKLGKKLFITGHGRCNVTNSGDWQAYERKIFRNPRFMRSSLSKFGPKDLMEFLEEHRVPTKQEDSGRVFPASDKSSDVIRAFSRELQRLGVRVELNTTVKSVNRSDDEFAVLTSRGTFHSKSLVLATGGASYPSTGSTGEGFDFARILGHTSVPLHPGLVGLVARNPMPELAGLTLPGSRLILRVDGKVVAKEEGDILFTHSGLSGPAVFRATCMLANSLKGKIVAEISFSGSHTAEEMSKWLQDQAAQRGSSELRTIVADMVPRRAAAKVIEGAGLTLHKKANQLTRQERMQLARAMTEYPLEITETRPMEEAIITIGGVSTKEIAPATMQSKRVPGLFFAGEVIDVSAYTGGYNLQIAFSTGRAAGTAAAAFALASK